MNQTMLETFFAEGKTKQIYLDLENDQHVVVLSKDNLTASNGRKHDVLKGEAVWAT